jgi:hypothetical protein
MVCLPSTELEIAIEMLLQFVVENDTKVSASVTFDLYSLFLIQPLEVGVVMGFAWFGKVVINSLPLTSALRVGEKAMAVLGECELGNIELGKSKNHFFTME